MALRESLGRRSDAGTIRITDRDIRVMTFMAEQYGLRRDQLCHLIPNVSERTLRAQIDRWVLGDLVRRRTVFAREHAWLWPTRAGLDLVAERFPYWEPRPGILEHVYWVNEIRFRVAKRHADAEWVSERRLRAEAGGANRPEHMPDALVVKAERRIAVEVQLAQKSSDRAESTLKHLVAHYDGTWLFARAGGPMSSMAAALRALGPDHGKVRLLPLEVG